ncbi:MAG: sn-glycerol-3-phosphate ABC transporter ATP-binding protein UgpC [Pseudomonadota bacterium]
MASADIQFESLSKSFGSTRVIEGLTARIDPGSFTVILGPSGCGKSTLLNMTAGLEQVTSGTIRMSGQDIQHLPPKDRGLAMVFQNYALYPHMSVADNIGYALKVAGVAKAERTRRVADAARVVSMEEYLDRRPGQLSGGQRQRVAIARAIVREPKVLLYDEPLSNLDAKLRHGMRMELSELHKRIGATSVFVTHDQVEAMTLADKIMVMNEGRIEQYAAPADIYHRPATQFVAQFIGAPPMNLIEADIDNGWVCLNDGTKIAKMPILQGYGSRSVVFGVRPEYAVLSDEGLGARVIYREALGAFDVLVVKLSDGTEFRVSTPLGSEAGALVGDVINLSFRSDALHFFDPQTGKALQYARKEPAET